MARRALAAHQKKAEREARTLIFVDESAFYVLPAVAKTGAPRGQTPVLKAPLLWDHRSVIGGITPEGKLFTRVQRRAIRSPDVVRFLQHLLRHIEGGLLVVWDGLPAHRSRTVRAFANEQAGRVHVERLPGYAPPGYAPELNPKEGIWKHLKRVELKNVCCPGLEALTGELRRAKERLRHKRAVIRACFRQVGLV